MEEEDKIGDLYNKSFQNFRVEEDNDDWAVIDQKLNKSSFLKFSYNQFNIYYAAAILYFIIHAGILAASHFFKESQNKDDGKEEKSVTLPANKQEENPIDTTISKEEIKGDTSIEGLKWPPVNNEIRGRVSKSPTIDTKKSNDSTKTNNNQKVLSVPGEAKKIVADSLLKKDTTSVVKKDSVKKVKKMIYIIKQDTLVNYDTLKVKKRKRGKRN